MSIPPIPLSVMTNGIRTMHNIESIVSERRNSAYDLQERHSGSTEEYLIACRTELQTVLRTLNVRDCQFAVPTISEVP